MGQHSSIHRPKFFIYTTPNTIIIRIKRLNGEMSIIWIWWWNNYGKTIFWLLQLQGWFHWHNSWILRVQAICDSQIRNTVLRYTANPGGPYTSIGQDLFSSRSLSKPMPNITEGRPKMWSPWRWEMNNRLSLLHPKRIPSNFDWSLLLIIRCFDRRLKVHICLNVPYNNNTRQFLPSPQSNSQFSVPRIVGIVRPIALANRLFKRSKEYFHDEKQVSLLLFLGRSESILDLP